MFYLRNNTRHSIIGILIAVVLQVLATEAQYNSTSHHSVRQGDASLGLNHRSVYVPNLGQHSRYQNRPGVRDHGYNTNINSINSDRPVYQNHHGRRSHHQSRPRHQVGASSNSYSTNNYRAPLPADRIDHQHKGDQLGKLDEILSQLEDANEEIAEEIRHERNDIISNRGNATHRQRQQVRSILMKICVNLR